MAILIIFIFLISAPVVSAEIHVDDFITSVNHSIYLRARTTGKIFPKGGISVTFYVDGKEVGKTLSTVDGYAILFYTPRSPGLKRLRAVAGDSEASGYLLVTQKKDRIILISVEDSLFDSPFSLNINIKTKDILTKLEKRYTLVYVTSLLGTGQTKEILKRYGLNKTVTIKWEGESTIEYLMDHGVSLYALIGSPEMIEQSGDYVQKTFSFKDTEEGKVVEDWEEIYKALSEKD